jgi:hypothetical protein
VFWQRSAIAFRVLNDASHHEDVLRSLRTLLTLALNVDKLPASRPDHLTPKERPPTHIREDAEWALDPPLPVRDEMTVPLQAFIS